jgi:hypothetical protein
MVRLLLGVLVDASVILLRAQALILQFSLVPVHVSEISGGAAAAVEIRGSRLLLRRGAVIPNRRGICRSTRQCGSEGRRQNKIFHHTYPLDHTANLTMRFASWVTWTERF